MTGKTTTEPRVNDEGPSRSKVRASQDREREGAHVRYACAACPYTRDLRCAWRCALAQYIHGGERP